MAESTTLSLNLAKDDIRAKPSVKRADLLRLAEPPGLSPIKFQVHRNYTFELIGSVLAPFLWLSRLKASLEYGDYDDSLSFSNVDPSTVQIISMDFERYREAARSSDFSDWLAMRLQTLRDKAEGPIIISNWPSAVQQAEQFNIELEKIAGGMPSVFVWDVASVFREMSGTFFDDRGSAKGTRLSNDACIELARNLGLIRIPSAIFPRIKAVAVDLDNTLFDGVLGEDGIEGIRVTPAHEALHRELLRLRDEGVFLAVLSKNDERDFDQLCRKRSDFPLKSDRFSARSIGWHSKPEGLARVADQLRIGIDSILVIDDNLGEISQIHARYPSAALLHSQNPVQTVFWLRHYPTLNGYRANSATQIRLRDLEASRQRDELRPSAGATDYVREMEIEFSYELNPTHLRSRLAELSQKTNQFNTGLRRFTEIDVDRLLEAPNHLTISIGLRDRFCDSGIIGAIFAHIDGARLVVDEISVSCRALGRTVESSMIALALAPVVETHRLRDIGFWFSEGPRNLPARNWLAAFTGIQEVTNSNVTTIAWQSIPQLDRHLQAAVRVSWDKVTA